MIKKILKKLGIDTEKEYCCIRCRKPMPAEKKRCPRCEAWNDCCSIDPRLLKK
ncbi:hypothetical protein GF336_07385 [Candidatus Woesearchaeota archaeon]|nr:hypothetical protein [Candidatus Woesearchaeota archaeon]